MSFFKASATATNRNYSNKELPIMHSLNNENGFSWQLYPKQNKTQDLLEASQYWKKLTSGFIQGKCNSSVRHQVNSDSELSQPSNKKSLSTSQPISHHSTILTYRLPQISRINNNSYFYHCSICSYFSFTFNTKTFPFLKIVPDINGLISNSIRSVYRCTFAG